MDEEQENLRKKWQNFIKLPFLENFYRKPLFQNILSEEQKNLHYFLVEINVIIDNWPRKFLEIKGNMARKPLGQYRKISAVLIAENHSTL